METSEPHSRASRSSRPQSSNRRGRDAIRNREYTFELLEEFGRKPSSHHNKKDGSSLTHSHCPTRSQVSSLSTAWTDQTTAAVAAPPLRDRACGASAESASSPAASSKSNTLEARGYEALESLVESTNARSASRSTAYSSSAMPTPLPSQSSPVAKIAATGKGIDDFFVGPRLANSLHQILRPHEFRLYYKLPKRGVEMAVNLRLTLAYKCATGKTYHLPLTCHRYRNKMTAEWSIAGIATFSFSSLSALVHYLSLYEWHNPTNKQLETLPVWELQAYADAEADASSSSSS